MPTDPTTTSQVQAYRFVLRRMESALVRKDAVMLHEPMRHHLRATAVGVVVAVLGLVAFVVINHGRLDGGDVNAGDIVRVASSDAVYVAVDVGELKLIQVPNMTSARLLVAAIAPGHEAPAPKSVSNDALEHYGRLAALEFPGAPAQLPTNLIRGVWSVCDAPAARPDRLAANSRPQLSTTVLIQEQPPAVRGLTDDQAVLVAEQNTGATYLLRREGRSRIDLRDTVTWNYYRFGTTVVPRKVSASLLNAIPEGHPFIFPALPPARPFPGLTGSQVGDVVKVKGVQDSYYLLLPGGKQQVEPAVADLIRFHHSTTPEPVLVTPAAIGQVPDAPPGEQSDFAGFPARAPQILKNTDASAACLTWQDPNQPPVVALNPEGLPLAQGESPVPITRAVSGQTADFVFLKPSKGALVRGVDPEQSPGSGKIWLVTDQGVRYGVPSTQVARKLGLGEATTLAPKSILSLLPLGVDLDPQWVLQQLSPELAGQLSRTGG